MRRTLVASYAMVCLSQFRYSTVIADKECPALFPVVGILLVSWDIALVYTFVVMCQYGWYVYAVWTWHTVFAVVAGNGLQSEKVIGDLLQESKLIVA